MNHYQITSATGENMGIYEGKDEQEALDNVAQAAGYKNYQETLDRGVAEFHGGIIEINDDIGAFHAADLLDTANLNPHQNGDLFISLDGVNIAYIGNIDTTGEFCPPCDWSEEEDGDCPALAEKIGEKLRDMIEADEPGWGWADYPEEQIVFAFADRSDEWKNALCEVADAMHLKPECPDYTIEEAMNYADRISMFARGEDAFGRWGEDAYKDWQKECEDRGLDGWPCELLD